MYAGARAKCGAFDMPRSAWFIVWMVSGWLSGMGKCISLAIAVLLPVRAVVAHNAVNRRLAGYVPSAGSVCAAFGSLCVVLWVSHGLCGSAKRVNSVCASVFPARTVHGPNAGVARGCTRA